MALVKELKEFLMRGNVIDMAVGIIIGGAFGKIVSSLVSDILMPPIAALMGSTNFNDLKVLLKQASVDAQGTEIPAITLNYGTFVQTVIDFLIIGTSIFFFIKAVNSLQKKKKEEPAAPPAPTKEEELLTEIRDLLKKGK
ncbi:MAG: large-conductance mechanosensitive channel protein MscL [Dysgonamonadaceae bacterium]|jgi:large conductance mechanosensitive channel|nr:large-conductance mechanosensitive channel protein MscL [Dysgonamonadaceae bacterium]